MFHLSGPGDVRVVAEEGSDVILPCSLDTMENIVTGLFDWKKDGQKEVFLYDAGLHYNNGRPGQDLTVKLCSGRSMSTIHTLNNVVYLDLVLTKNYTFSKNRFRKVG